jgi:N-acetylglutamate synthase-like GNAT family acetyltransferase
MTISNQQIRRATVEDLPRLLPLWKQEQLPWQELEKRFKEFQLVEGPDGEIPGALGFQVAGQEGQLHSEAFAHAEQADALRDKLWSRAQNLAGNHGLIRVWTQLASPFWRTNGFQTANAETMTKLPGSFGGGQKPWLFLQLKEETASAPSLDKEFALFKEAEKESTQKLFRQARVMKILAVIVAVGVLVLVAIWAIMFFKVQNRR